MKISKQFEIILAVSFFIPLIRQMINAVLLRLTPRTLDMGSYYIALLINYLTLVVSLIIIPILIFALFYYIGKKPYLAFEMRTILLALLIGNIASLFVGSVIFSTIAGIPATDIIVIILQYILTHFVVDYLAALAGLSIGYIRQKKLTLPAEPELS